MQSELENSVEDVWQLFKTDILSKNRYFAGNNILPLLDKFYMIDMFPASTKIDFYRARIGDFTKDGIGSLLAPPKGKALAGRCNSEGISYLSSCQKTAVAEVRPNCGDIVSVAKFKVDVSRIFSFRVYFQGLPIPTNPNSQDSLYLIRLIDNDLASTVTKERKLDYIPFQYVSEYIKNRGFNGFVYSSTVGPGMNLVLFDWQERIDLIETKAIKIKNVNYDY